jgi:RNA polymerase sigma-70 factor (ECF subfamily)
MTSPPRLSAASDRDVVAAARLGRENAYAELLRRHHGTVHAFIQRLVRDRDLADDLTQDVFVKAFGELESHRPEHKFSSWILKIANNQAVDHLRREGSLKRRGLETVPLEPTPDASGPRTIAAHKLRTIVSNTATPTPLDVRALAPALDEALERLRRHDRLCFILRELEGRSYEDIAEILDLPLGTVGPSLTRARRELRAALGPLYDTLRRSSFTPRPSPPTPPSPIA